MSISERPRLNAKTIYRWARRNKFPIGFGSYDHCALAALGKMEGVVNNYQIRYRLSTQLGLPCATLLAFEDGYEGFGGGYKKASPKAFKVGQTLRKYVLAGKPV